MSALANGARSERTSGIAVRATRRGQVLGGTYRLLERIGAGGMADVYAAEHTRLSRQFAVKVLRADDEPRALDRFHREVRAIARIENEYVVNIMDCGEADDGTPYLVMDRLCGEDLRCLLERDSPLPIPRAVNLIWEACQGIAAVHDTGLIHRDLKPGNLFVSRRATGEDWCKVLDFGVAKIDTSTWTTEGAVVGTVRYMAPEQLRDGTSVGPGADIYALGAILYECLTGASPYSSTSVQELMFKIMNEDPTPLDERRREIPAALGGAVLRAMAKSPSERFTTVQDFARAIAPFAGMEVRAEVPAELNTVSFERAENSAPQARRRTTTAFVAGLLLGLSIFVVGGAVRRGSAVKPALLVPALAPIAIQPISPPPLAESVVQKQSPVIAPPSGSNTAPSPKRKLPQPLAPRSMSLANARFDADNPYLR